MEWRRKQRRDALEVDERVDLAEDLEELGGRPQAERVVLRLERDAANVGDVLRDDGDEDVADDVDAEVFALAVLPRTPLHLLLGHVADAGERELRKVAREEDGVERLAEGLLRRALGRVLEHRKKRLLLLAADLGEGGSVDVVERLRAVENVPRSVVRRDLDPVRGVRGLGERVAVLDVELLEDAAGRVGVREGEEGVDRVVGVVAGEQAEEELTAGSAV